MYKRLLKTAFIMTSFAAALWFASATGDSSLISRGERMPQHGNFNRDQMYRGGAEGYHPEAREAARQDYNRNADANALENAEVPSEQPNTTINVNPTTPYPPQ